MDSQVPFSAEAKKVMAPSSLKELVQVVGGAKTADRSVVFRQTWPRVVSPSLLRQTMYDPGPRVDGGVQTIYIGR